jgi:hypothetical protein
VVGAAGIVGNQRNGMMKKWSFGLWVVAACVAGGVVSCASPDRPPRVAPAKPSMFAPAAMRLHPTFTQVMDTNNDGVADSIEAEVEFTDKFGDPTKAEGQFMFELFSFRQDNPDPRGSRLVNPFVASIVTPAEQESRWNRTTRTYSFRLATPAVGTRNHFVLTASFVSSSGKRFTDRTVLLPLRSEAK